MAIDLNEINTFYRVVREGSFTRAAAALGLPKSTVSERVSALEERLGVRLLERTTRKLRPTDAGQRYYERAARIIAEAEEADATVAELAHSPRGLVRIAAPLVAARALLNAVICEYLEKYPHAEVELVAADRRIDLIEEGVDLGIHVLGLPDASWVARRLGETSRVFVAAPEYVRRRGIPRTPDDLATHDLVAVGADRRTRWRFEKNGAAEEREVHARYAVTSVELAIDAVSYGIGVCTAPMILAGELIRSGRVVRVLPEWSAGWSSVSLVYPSGRHLSNRVRLLAELIRQRFAEVPSWRLEGALPE